MIRLYKMIIKALALRLPELQLAVVRDRNEQVSVWVVGDPYDLPTWLTDLQHCLELTARHIKDIHDPIFSHTIKPLSCITYKCRK